MKVISVVVFCVLLVSCGVENQVKKENKVDVYENIPSELKEVFEAHGGLDQWREMNSLTYRLKRGERNELHQIDLSNRKVRLKGGEWVIGFDGKEVWVSPDKETYGGNSARFYHNLIFYFYAMPFVLGDPGITYTQLDPMEIQGRVYDRVSIRFDEGVGDAPDDEYILCYHPESKQMEWLMYTVTYYSKEPGKKYNALHYNNWQDVNGLLLPTSMVGYRTSGDSITEKRYESFFEDIAISSDVFDQNMFEIPDGAEIDSLN